MSKTWLWLAALGIGGYFAYTKGYLAILGLCPAGSTLGSDMFPACFFPGGAQIGTTAASLASCGSQPGWQVVTTPLGSYCQPTPGGAVAAAIAAAPKVSSSPASSPVPTPGPTNTAAVAPVVVPRGSTLRLRAL